jgi:PAS domain S-box-containing protein
VEGSIVTSMESSEALSGALSRPSLEPRVLAEQVRMLYARAPIAQATVVVNASIVAWVFWELVPPGLSLAWVAALCALAAVRIGLARAYRRSVVALPDARVWARRFAAGAALTGVGWGAAALLFYAPGSPAHQMFLAFALGGMTAGAAASNASYAPAFVAFAVPALLPMVVRLTAERDPIHAAMAVMMGLFGIALAWISRSGGRAVEEAIRLRFRNEALVEGLSAAQERLESLNAGLERRVGERTRELERMLALRRASEARLAVTLRSIGDAVIATDEEGGVMVFNGVAEELTGWNAKEAIGRPLHEVFDVIDEDTRQPAASPVDRVLREGVVVGLANHTALIARDGTERPIADSGAPIRDAGGRIVGVVLVFRDQTTERQAQKLVEQRNEELRETDRRKNEFIAVLSHELRNPLASIRNSLYLLDHAPPGSEGLARAREIIHRQTGHLTRLVGDLLDVTRISRGKVELQRACIDAREVVRRACDDHRTLFHDRSLGLRVQISGPAWIEADETRIAQVVGNLLQNAAKFSRDGGVVTVSVDASEGQAQIRVRDDGIGITPELLPRVFEPFVQADGGLARTKGGLGLGLALVKGLVELHGGSVAAYSEGAGGGAEFVVNLPLAPVPEQPSRAAWTWLAPPP